MVRARSPRFFFFFFLFFSASLFSLSFLISLAPRLRRDAFIFLFIFSFYFCSFFLLLFLSLFFGFLFLFLLLFFFLFFFLVFIFASPFLFCLSFCFTFYPPYSNLFPHYPTARQPFIFSLPPPIFPIPSSHFSAAVKRKKYRQKNPQGGDGLTGANGQRKERQRDGMG